jgi:hypothetical protein
MWKKKKEPLKSNHIICQKIVKNRRRKIATRIHFSSCSIIIATSSSTARRCRRRHFLCSISDARHPNADQIFLLHMCLPRLAAR